MEEGLTEVKDKKNLTASDSSIKQVLTYALLDSGSERLFCVRDLASKVGAREPTCRLHMKTLLSGASIDEVELVDFCNCKWNER